MARLRRVAEILIGLVAILLCIIGIIIAAIESGWGKDQLRRLIVRQANEYLTATLEIDSLSGSLFRGIELGHVRLSRDGKPLVAIDAIELAYSIRELLQPGVVIRRVRLVRPRVVAARQPDGRWNLGALIKRERHEQQRSGPGRPIEVQAIEIEDGHITLDDPLEFGAAHVPTDFAALNASLAFGYYPVRWELSFKRMSWVGSKPSLTAKSITGVFGHGPDGWFFQTFRVVTPRSTFTLQGGIDTETNPTAFSLQVVASRFSFQEWGGVLHGLQNIAVDASFDTSLTGNPRALGADLRLASTGGAIRGHVTLDTTEPGWYSRGVLTVDRLELGHWLNEHDRRSQITGRVTFDLALGLGQHFPRGTYQFEGSHAMYVDYSADNLRASGRITAREVLIERASGRAYGATLAVNAGSIGIERPYRFRFAGDARGVDLRRVPAAVPVPRVESALNFRYDVSGRFHDPFIAGTATFGMSRFLGATIGAGTVGTIDTSRQPLAYSGDGDITGLEIGRFGQGLDVAWMRDPRFSGTIDGRFRVEGRGNDHATLDLTASGRLRRAELFGATFSDADVSLTIEDGALKATYDGTFSGVDPAIPFGDDRFTATLSGTGRVNVAVGRLLTADHLALDDYDISGSLSLDRSTVRGVQVDQATIEGALHDDTLSIAHLMLKGQALDGTASGSITFADQPSIDVAYDVTRLDLGSWTDVIRRKASGTVATKGHAAGPIDALRLAGDLSASNVDVGQAQALALTGTYDLTINGQLREATQAQLDLHASFLTVFGTAIQDASATASYAAPTLTFDVGVAATERRRGRLAGTVSITQPREHITAVSISELNVTLGTTLAWRLASSAAPATVTWSDGAIDVTPMTFIEAAGGQGRVGVSGSWHGDGSGALHLVASHLFLESLEGAGERPARFGGVLDADATVRGTRERPAVTVTATITNGRIERVTYESLTGHIDYADERATIDVDLEQGSGISINAAGTVPLALFDRSVADQPIDVTIRSTSINLGLIEGVTSLVRDVTGDAQFDVHVVGSGHAPRFEGSVSLANAGFVVSSTGARYRNASASIQLATDRVTVQSLQVQDSGGHQLVVSGSLGTRELRVGDLELNATARRFEVIRNELGRLDIDAALRFRGTFDQPQVTGNIAVSGGELRVDEVLTRALFQPYATAPTELDQLDAVAALNPWDRLTLDVALRVPALRLAGSNIQIASGTPLGLGDIRLRVAGDLYLYKDRRAPLSVTGSLDSVSGSIGFQGRRFNVDESASSINFQGELTPEIFVSVVRQIAGVEARVTLSGALKQPELQLSSVPPLDPSNILSLVVFNTSINELTPAQQQELVVRAGTLAAGFLAAPMVSAIQQQIGLQVLDIEPSSDLINVGPRVTVGQELAPGLVARFSRQFGQEPYDQVTFEYYLSRILRLRATFSDAQSLMAISPFRRIERAGVDLLFFFNF